MSVLVLIASALGAILLGAIAFREWRIRQWQKANRRPGFVHHTGKKRVG